MRTQADNAADHARHTSKSLRAAATHGAFGANDAKQFADDALTSLHEPSIPDDNRNEAARQARSTIASIPEAKGEDASSTQCVIDALRHAHRAVHEGAALATRAPDLAADFRRLDMAMLDLPEDARDQNIDARGADRSTTPRDHSPLIAANIWHSASKICILNTFSDQEAPVTDRRAFIGSLIGASVALPHVKLPRMRGDAFKHLARAQSLEDEAYWAEIQRAFDLDRTMVNLNNGGCSPAPTHVLEQMIRDLRFSNELPVEHMWSVLEPRIESVRRELARDFGCDPEEMAITRNASESNETMILGLDLKRGDEVVFTTQNYPRMQTTWRQRERRDGVVIKAVRQDTPVHSADDYVNRIAEAITPRTRVIEVMHISFMTGYIAPVRRIVDLARPKEIAVFVDGAHAYAHFPFTRDDLGCDYYGTSLHKWLMAPIGTGFLYVRKDKIPSLWPMMAAAAEQTSDIRKYEEIGTHPAANHNAIAVALAFHRAIGAERKIARLRMLRDRWAKRLLAASDRVKMLTPIGPNESGAIGVVAVEGMDIGKLQGWLLSKHHIVTTPLIHPEFQGLRVTPNVYTTLDEVDLFASRMEEAIRRGIA